jgi:segregation and condensation protein B
MNLEQKIEALLFYKNEPMEIKKISKILGVGESEIKESLKNLEITLKGRGICIITTTNEVSLATSPETRDFIEQIAKDEMRAEIGKAGLETLAIILYNGPVSRREIDYIRGVNSTFILRNLSMRGLVEKEADKEDQRIFKYRASLPLLAHLGIKRIEELPDFAEVKSKTEQMKNENDTD